MALTRAEAIELFENGPREDTRIAFEKAMQNVKDGTANETVDTEESEDSETVVIPEKVDTLSSGDAADKVPEPKKEATDTPADKKTETKSEESIDPVEARLELMERELKLKDLKLDRMQVQLENREKLARQRASDIGNLKQGARQADPTENERRTSLIDDVRLENPQGDDEWKQGVNQTLTEQAITAEMMAFAGENEDADNYLDFMIPYVEAHKQDYQIELSSGNPKAAARATNLLMREAYVAAKEAKYDTELTTLRETRQKQLDELKEKKQGASASGGSAGEAASGGKSAANKTLKDLSDDELRTLLNQNRYNK